MKLAELEAKAKALAGTGGIMISDERLAEIRGINTWQKLMDDDPMDVVATLLDEVERLRAENAMLSHHLTVSLSTGTLCAKLAKAREALKWYATGCCSEEVRSVARQALKEIGE